MKRIKRLFRINASGCVISLFLRAFGSLVGFYQQLTPFPHTGFTIRAEDLTVHVGSGRWPIEVHMPGPNSEYSVTGSANFTAPVGWWERRE